MFEDILGPELGAEVDWPASDAPISDSDLGNLFSVAVNIHKPIHFIPVYESTFSPYRDRPIRMLEIGVACGGSIELWRQYFYPDAVIVGIDGNPQCARFNDPSRNIHIRIGRQENQDFLKSLVDEFGPFDIILDDGSHIPSYTLKTFRHLFMYGLTDGGVYLVEDLEVGYWPVGHEPFKNETDANDGSPTFIEFVKSLMDVMNAHYMKAESTEDFEVMYPYGLPINNPHRLSSIKVPLATTIISKVDVHDGIVAIHRKSRELPRILMKTSKQYLDSWARGK